MELRHLRYFLVIGEALSRQVQDLEDEIGVDLLPALKSAVEESERESTDKEYPLSNSLKLRRDATGYSIGQGDATFIFPSLDDLKRFSESVSRRISEFVTP